jgi:hypothetical protein
MIGPTGLRRSELSNKPFQMDVTNGRNVPAGHKKANRAKNLGWAKYLVSKLQTTNTLEIQGKPRNTITKYFVQF